MHPADTKSVPAFIYNATISLTKEDYARLSMEV